MSTFKYSKGKLVELPTMPDRKTFDYREESWQSDWFHEDEYNAAMKKYKESLSSLRTYIAEGFAEDEIVEEKDIELVCRYGKHCYTLGTHECQYIARKVTKEEGEKPFIALTFDTMMTGGNTDNEKAFFKLGYEVADKEIERLKGLIEKAFMFGWMSYPDPDAHDFMQTKYNTIDTSWEKFKSENNLT